MIGKLSKIEIINESGRRNRIKNDILKVADNIINDPDRKNRLKKCECVICYYHSYSKVGGASITKTCCKSCNREMVFGSTCTDALCLECAKKHKLCRDCGANLDLSTRRRNYKSIENQLMLNELGK